MKLGIDCDGVLANFTSGFAKEAKKLFPAIDTNHVSKGWDDLYGLSRDEQSQVWDAIKATPNWWMKLDPYPENITALHMFLYSQRDNDIYIVTSRVATVGSSLAFQTDVWLRACGIQPHGNYIGVLAVDDWYDKRRIYRHGQFDVSIDDKTETVEDCDKLSDTGIQHTAFLLDRPWNQHAKVKHRVGSLDEFFKAVVALKK